MDILDKAKRFVWAFVELGFAAVLAIMLIYLILGENSGVFVLSVADNVMKFANAVPTPSLVGLAVLVALIYLVVKRLGPPASDGTPGPAPRRPRRSKSDLTRES